LIRQENELLTRTGPATPGGELLRRYWQPVALSRELRDDEPLPVQIMGEKLVLFRGKDGKPALLGQTCPHRCTDLSYGRIEDGGLRCLYHGWLFDAAGHCIEQPAEPEGSTYKDEIRHTAYPCREAAGAVFAYMGPGEPPLFPGFHFLSAPDERVYQTKLYHECNFQQANEGNIDPSHLSFLHSFTKPLERSGSYREAQQSMISDTRPRIDAETTRFGMRIFTQRKADGGRTYLRVTNFVFPNLAFFSGHDARYGEGGYTAHWHVPIDDETHWRYDFLYHSRVEVNKAELRDRVAEAVGPDFLPFRNPRNRYLQDRGEMATSSFAGMGHYFGSHDLFAVQSQGAILDRTREHLGTTDIPVVKARRMLLDGIRAVQKGKAPPLDLRSPNENVFNDLLVLSAMLQPGQTPEAYCREVSRIGDFHALRELT
jgi:phthalate 4,5-dioxygenase oxygenase subunit